jgi:hypothetical protein
VRKDYQNKKNDTSQPAVPETVSVALAELVGEVHEGLLAQAVGTGLQVMAAMMEADVTGVCGPALRTALERHVVAENVRTTKHNHTRNAA